jgi:hypothetical protein
MRGGKGNGLLASRQSTCELRPLPEHIGQLGQHPGQPRPIILRPSQGLSFTQKGETFSVFAQREQGAPHQVVAELDAQPPGIEGIRQVPERCRACSKYVAAWRNAAWSLALAPACRP